MTPQDLIDHYGTVTKAAAEIGKTENTVRNWVKSGEVPYISQLAYETLTKGKLMAENEVSK